MPRICGIYVASRKRFWAPFFAFAVARRQRLTAYGKEKRLEGGLAELLDFRVKVSHHNQHGCFVWDYAILSLRRVFTMYRHIEIGRMSCDGNVTKSCMDFHFLMFTVCFFFLIVSSG